MWGTNVSSAAAGEERALLHWTGVAIALAVGGWTAVRDPALPLFEQLARSLGFSGPGIQLYSIAYVTLEVFLALLLAYVLVTLLLRALAARLF